MTSGLWGTLDEFLITGHDNGELVQWDIKVKRSRFRRERIANEHLLGDGRCAKGETTSESNHGFAGKQRSYIHRLIIERSYCEGKRFR